MPTYTMTGPDGRDYSIDGPAGATPAQVASAIQAQIAQAKAASPQANPTDGNSFLGNLAAGVGKGVTDIGLGLKQRLDDAAAALENKFGGQSINKALGMQNAADIQKQTQAAVDEKRRLDAPLMQTAGGKIGNFSAQAVPAVAAAFVPGGQTLAGTILSGAALGAVQPTSADESVLGNAAMGAAGGAAGYGIAKGVGSLLSKPGSSTPMNAVADAARDAGYVIPPAQTNNSLMNNILEGLSGKMQMRQQAALRNQSVTNSLAARAVGLPENTPLTVDALNTIRQDAGLAYQEVKNVGTFGVDQEYDNALKAIASKYSNASNDFPTMTNGVQGMHGVKTIPEIVDTFRPAGNSFDAGAAIDAISVAREMADSAYASGNKALGTVYKKSAGALEDLVDRNLQTYESAFPGNGFGDLLGDFRDARQLIAKTYSVQKGLNVATGDVNAAKIGAQLQKGVPLSGELEQIGMANKAFPFATKETTTSMPGVSPLDLAAGATGSLASGSPIPMLLGPGRMAVRSMMLSKPYQAAFGSADSGISGAVNAVLTPISDAVATAAPYIGNAGAALALKQRQVENLARLRAYEDRIKAEKIARIGQAQNVDQAIQAAQESLN